MSNLIPLDQRDGVIWWNGRFVDWASAKIHVLTHGLHYASSVFEGERAYGGVVFKSREHSDRLIRSGELLGMTIPYTAAQLDAAKADIVARSGMKDCYIRAIAWRGSEALGVSAPRNSVQVAIAAWEWPAYFKNKMEGIRIANAQWRRPAPDTAPVKAKAAGLYMICTLSKHAAEARGYSDAMMLDYRGLVAECTGAHIFFGKDGALHTPTADCLLDGITRATVMDLARDRKIAVHARDIRPEELAGFTECFVVGTAAEVTPVREIEGVMFTPGRLCEQIVGDYDALVRRQLHRAAA